MANVQRRSDLHGLRRGATARLPKRPTEKRHDESPDETGKGPIAMLQEFVQCSKAFPLPPNYSALQWTYVERAASKASLEYRATVAFYLEGVPHHAVGGWQPSKKQAQRDAADRALRLFVGKWAEDIKVQPEEAAWRSRSSVAGDEECLLVEFCAQLPACAGSGPPTWNVEAQEDSPDDSRCFAIVELHLHGVPHHLAGSPQRDAAAARADAARRALWYLQCPGFEDLFQAERMGVPREIGKPQGGWLCDDSNQAIDEARRKTAVMRLQNRLQQTFARHLPAGQGVWHWNFESEPDEGAPGGDWQTLYRAQVTVPVLGKTFSGDWAGGQHDAQLDVIARVSTYLDDMESNVGQRMDGRCREREDFCPHAAIAVC